MGKDKYEKVKEAFKDGDWVFGIGEHKGCSPVFNHATDNPQPFSYLNATNTDDFRLATDDERAEVDASFNLSKAN